MMSLFARRKTIPLIVHGEWSRYIISEIIFDVFSFRVPYLESHLYKVHNTLAIQALYSYFIENICHCTQRIDARVCMGDILFISTCG